MRHLFAIAILFVTTVIVEMYQDRVNPGKTIIFIEKNGVTNTYVVDDKDLNDELVDRLVKENE